MKYLLLVILFSSLVASVYSAVALEIQVAVPGYENFCLDKEDGRFYKAGEEMIWKLGGCGRKICGGPYKKGFVIAELQACGAIGMPPSGCHTEVDIELPYPKCCKQIICPDKTLNIT